MKLERSYKQERRYVTLLVSVLLSTKERERKSRSAAKKLMSYLKNKNKIENQSDAGCLFFPHLLLQRLVSNICLNLK